MTLGLQLLVPPQCMLISKNHEKSSTAAEGTIYFNFLTCSRFFSVVPTDLLCSYCCVDVVSVCAVMHHVKAKARAVVAKLKKKPPPNKKPPIDDILNCNIICVSLLCLRPHKSEEIARGRSGVCVWMLPSAFICVFLIRKVCISASCHFYLWDVSHPSLSSISFLLFGLDVCSL